MNIKIDNLNIDYLKKGNSDNKILLLHGWGCNKEIFNNLINNLSQYMEVYAIDFPGFGKSDEPKEAWGVDEYTDLVVKFINAMNINEISLLGHSFGGRVIIKLANRENLNFKIKKIVLVDAAGIKHTPRVTRKQKFYKKVFPIIKKISPKLLNYIKTKVGSADYRNATPMMRDILVKTVNEDLKDLIPNIKQPTLLIWGTEDTATPYEDAIFMNQNIKDSGIVKIDGAGHFSFLEQPYLVNKVLDSFLNEQKPEK